MAYGHDTSKLLDKWLGKYPVNYSVFIDRLLQSGLLLRSRSQAEICALVECPFFPVIGFQSYNLRNLSVVFVLRVIPWLCLMFLSEVLYSSFSPWPVDPSQTIHVSTLPILRVIDSYRTRGSYYKFNFVCEQTAILYITETLPRESVIFNIQHLKLATTIMSTNKSSLDCCGLMNPLVSSGSRIKPCLR